MYTSEILARANRQAKGFSRADLISLLNTAVQILYTHETPQTMEVDGSTGFLPYLETTAGNLGPYEGPSNCWRVSNVLVRAPGAQYRDYGFSHSRLSDDDVVEINGHRYHVFRYVRSVDAAPGFVEEGVGRGVPLLLFTVDPGTTTTHYHLQAYWKHPEIESDRIQLRIPDAGGAHQTIVIPALIKLVEGQNHGNYIEAVEYIEQNLKPRLWKILGSGAQGKRRETTRRPW